MLRPSQRIPLLLDVVPEIPPLVSLPGMAPGTPCGSGSCLGGFVSTVAGAGSGLYCQ